MGGFAMRKKFKKKLLVTSRRTTPPFFVGGDSVSMYLWAKYLASKNYEVVWIGSYNEASDSLSVKNTYSIKGELTPSQIQNVGYKYKLRLEVRKRWYGVSYKDKNTHIQWHLVSDIEHYNKIFQSTLLQLQPDAVITYLEGAIEAMDLSAEVAIPVFNIIHDMESWQIPTLLVADYYGHDVIFVSNACERKYRPLLRYSKSKVIYPPFQKLISGNSGEILRERKYVTMINPTIVKGSELLRKIIEKMPHVQFLVVKNWTSDNDVVKLSKYSNVSVIARQVHINDIYKQTKVLLAPSFWEEAFGRVIVEAALEGVPTIGSNRGGIPEAIGTEGGSVLDYNNSDAWVKEIEKYLHNNRFQIIGRRARLNALRRFCGNKNLSKLENYIISQLK